MRDIIYIYRILIREAVNTNYHQKSNFKEPRDFTHNEISSIVKRFILNSIFLNVFNLNGDSLCARRHGGRHAV